MRASLLCFVLVIFASGIGVAGPRHYLPASDSARVTDSLHLEKASFRVSEPLVVLRPEGALGETLFLSIPQLDGFVYTIYRWSGDGWAHVLSKGSVGFRMEYLPLPARLMLEPIREVGVYRLQFRGQGKRVISTTPFQIVR